MSRKCKSSVLTLTVVLVVALSLVAACAKPTPAPAPQPSPKPTAAPSPVTTPKPPIKIGIVHDLSGVAAEQGKVFRDVHVMLLDQVNAAGGINGQLIEYIVADDASDATRATTTYRRLVERDNVAAVLGGSASTAALAMLKVAEETRVPLLAPAVAADAFFENPWTFSMYLPGEEVMRALALGIKAKGFKTVAFEHNSLAWGLTAKERLLKVAPEYGIQVGSTEASEVGAPDLTVIATKLRNAKADALAVWDYPGERATFIKAMNQISWNPPTFHEGFSMSMAAGILKGLTLAEGHFVLEYWDPKKTEAAAAFDQYQKKYGVRLEAINLLTAYDATNALVEAIKKAGTNPQAIRDALESINMPMSSGKVGARLTLGPKKHNGLDRDNIVWVRIKDGKYSWE